MTGEHEQDCQDGCDDRGGYWCGRCEDAVGIMRWSDPGESDDGWARHEAAHEAGSATLVPREDCPECQQDALRGDPDESDQALLGGDPDEAYDALMDAEVDL